MGRLFLFHIDLQSLLMERTESFNDEEKIIMFQIR